MGENDINNLYAILDQIEVNDSNKVLIENVKTDLQNGDYTNALINLQQLQTLTYNNSLESTASVKNSIEMQQQEEQKAKEQENNSESSLPLLDENEEESVSENKDEIQNITELDPQSDESEEVEESEETDNNSDNINMEESDNNSLDDDENYDDDDDDDEDDDIISRIEGRDAEEESNQNDDFDENKLNIEDDEPEKDNPEANDSEEEPEESEEADDSIDGLLDDDEKDDEAEDYQNFNTKIEEEESEEDEEDLTPDKLTPEEKLIYDAAPDPQSKFKALEEIKENRKYEKEERIKREKEKQEEEERQKEEERKRAGKTPQELHQDTNPNDKSITDGYELPDAIFIPEIIDEDNPRPNYNEEMYPPLLRNLKLECIFIGLLVQDPMQIAMYYYPKEIEAFSDSRLQNVYKMILFTDGQSFAPEIAKAGYNFGVTDEYYLNMKYELQNAVEQAEHTFNMEQVFTELKKLFIIRKAYMGMPISIIQHKIMQIVEYELYENMKPEEIEEAIDQVQVTDKFKQGILSENLTGFLEKGSNTLTSGISLPFPLLTKTFKGVRQGEMMAYAMPSNAGKSRFTLKICAFLALVHKKKIFIISNEMTEEKMRLCLITTVLNDPILQKIHGKNLHVSENQLLGYQFLADDPNEVEVDDFGYIVQKENEPQADFIARLKKYSSQFRDVIYVTDWVNKKIDGYIYFTYITDHTNDELRKLVMNYYYRYHIQYVIYDTLKTDIENIGNAEELKKTTTLLSNIAQTYNTFVGASLQLQENKTPPLDLNVTDLSVAKTVKEVLDTLYLFKQIHEENLDEYEYSLNEVDTEFFDIKHYTDPDVRYYACVVDKNRAGPKPKLLFRLNLAYNHWEELGYLRLKQGEHTFDYATMDIETIKALQAQQKKQQAEKEKNGKDDKNSKDEKEVKEVKEEKENKEENKEENKADNVQVEENKAEENKVEDLLEEIDNNQNKEEIKTNEEVKVKKKRGRKRKNFNS